MKKLYVFLIIGVVAVVAVAVTLAIASNRPQKTSQASNSRSDKIYVAAEDSGEVDVIDVAGRSVIAQVNLSEKQNGNPVMYMAHNVQVAPDGKSVWVTANAMSGEHTSLGSDPNRLLIRAARAEAGHQAATSDQLIVIDPRSDKITRRINIGTDLHLAHVVLMPDSKFALAVAQQKGEIYKIDTKTYQVVQTIPTKAGAQPHGLRLSPDGKQAYIAMMGGKSLGQLDIATGTLSYTPLTGTPVQIGVTSDGKYALATVFDGKTVAVLSIADHRLEYVTLPPEARGPLQLYPTSDGKYAFVADQGNYFDQPDGNKLYKIDLGRRQVVETIKVGTAPHGVVVSPDDKYVYVTNLVSSDLSIVDAATNQEIAKIPVGAKPNGVSYWTKQ